MATSAALAGLSMGATVGNTYSQMQSIQNQADYMSSVYNQNAKIAEGQEASVGQQGTYQQNQIRQRGRQVAGSQKAAFAANGLDTSAGTPLSVLSDTAYLSEQDAQTSRYNTALQMWGLQNEANSYRDQSNYTQAAASSAKKAMLLNGLTSVAMQYANFAGGSSGSGKTGAGKGSSAGINTGYKSASPFTNAQGNYPLAASDYTFNRPLMGDSRYTSFFAKKNW